MALIDNTTGGRIVDGLGLGAVRITLADGKDRWTDWDDGRE